MLTTKTAQTRECAKQSHLSAVVSTSSATCRRFCTATPLNSIIRTVWNLYPKFISAARTWNSMTT
jgi:hypothetical protein